MGDLLTCPRCEGIGGFEVLAHRAGECTLEKMDCPVCKGNGRITRKVLGWLEIGKQHRDARVDRMESLMECSRNLGISPAELSAMETGRADPSRLLAAKREN